MGTRSKRQIGPPLWQTELKKNYSRCGWQALTRLYAGNGHFRVWTSTH